MSALWTAERRGDAHHRLYGERAEDRDVSTALTILVLTAVLALMVLCYVVGQEARAHRLCADGVAAACEVVQASRSWT